MMMKSERTLECWRKYFRRAEADIFGIIHNAILVAAADYPNDFRFRRDGIAELLFSCRFTRCSGCNRVELATPAAPHGEPNNNTDHLNTNININNDNNINTVDDDDDDDVDFVDIEGDEDEESGGGDGGGGGVSSSREKEGSKTNSSSDNVRISRADTDVFNHNNSNDDDQLISNYSYGEAEALTDEIEEASQVVGEVLRIKDLFLNYRDESDSVLVESLRKLELLALTVDTLKATEIGKAVNGLRKHRSKEIQRRARTLIEGWKVLVDEWYSATKAIGGNEGTPDSANPSVLDEEEGLPSPPLDEAAFFDTHPNLNDFSENFWDGIHDDGRNVVLDTRNRNHGNTGNSSLRNENTKKQNKPTTTGANTMVKDNKIREKRQEAVMKPSKPSTANSGPRRPQEQSYEQKKNDSKLQQKMQKITTLRKPLISQETCSETKYEATKRKLHESYQQHEIAKRQRTVQMMELHDLPKPASVCRNPHMRPGNHNRHGAHGRR
ncbi:hypothetical protein Tsubulata_018222 [Turnera subulata]|uniref:TFIIS N-terminal domain-containing protein n=1 Tax=Turnera subulata TaxID=218843 RepID=A0A9Q0JEE8_9ROSI|nr:hypothetical protein Tsubulata_018222 [Turnera subulata]